MPRGENSEDQEEWEKDYKGHDYSGFSSDRDLPDRLFTLASILKKDLKIFYSYRNNHRTTGLKVAYSSQVGEVDKIELQNGLNSLGKHSKLTKKSIEDFLK